MATRLNNHSPTQGQSDKPWLDLRHHSNKTIMKPDELEPDMKNPPGDVDMKILDRIHGSMLGMALGDALGAHVEFRPHAFLLEHPVTDLESGGTWGLEKGQFTDDTSMALCLANSLVVRRNYDPYDQLVRYKWWYRYGYMSSTGHCFDIGAATRQSLTEFERRQKEFAKKYDIPLKELDFLSEDTIQDGFDVKCSEEGVAGNGALMRLAPVPLFFYRDPIKAVEYSGHSGEITHGDQKAIDACRYYGALIVAAVNGAEKKDLLDKKFYDNHKDWFGDKPLHAEIENIARGSYQEKGGYDKGIRGKGYIVDALRAALWAFWSDEGLFKKGVLAAVNLGDDTDTTAAIYGQLAGAVYGYKELPDKWKKQVYAKDFIECLSKWLAYEGNNWRSKDSLVADFDKQSRPRCRTFVDSSDTLKPRSSDQPFPVGRPKSAEHRNPDSQQLYFLKNFQSVDDVYHWFENLGKDFIPYANTFKGHNIDAYWLLNQVNTEKLAEYGVEREDHRQIILDGIEEFRKKCPVKFAGKE